MSQRFIVGTLAAAALVAAGYGAWRVYADPGTHQVQETQAYTQPVTRIVFDDMHANDIRVRARDGAGGVTVGRTLRWTEHRPRAVEHWDGSTLIISVECDEARFYGECGIDYAIEVPPAVEIVADVSSGDVLVDGTSGPIRVTASSGDVHLLRTRTQRIQVETTSGDITGEGLEAGSLVASVTSGDVQLAYADAPTTVAVTATSGDVGVTMPSTGTAYQVSMRTTSGDQHSDFASTAGAAGSITVSTTSGDVSLRRA
ncbi:DUF4097 family beta strand repeat-containing protein [Hamadaea tsunoensis]|uniref:DUF4097 family beta strand repeat-containing protein n=1 Tax=Hamadaea tsunoensis TaxID=53368 RepID=UPI00041141E4|nr:DUF4097 family beta strand repeat-containing protein [Hamadaea tsunoensis]